MKYLVIFTLLAALFACSTARVVKTEKAPGVDFTTYKTFDFYELGASGDTTGNKFNTYTDMLRQAISRELEAKGYRRESTDPDLRVNIGIVVKEEAQTRETTIREAPRYMGQRRYSWKSEQVEVGRYKTGTATIDLVDSRKNMMVWEGVMEGIISKKQSSYESDVNKGISQLFEKFPD
ncbi:MAG: DUF4136 domain-containing protein [Chitinophagaceae bacterium]|nr:MAG: DUF4136 domain-containing protein [Chitinophagaceae bacterium]